MLSIPDGPLLGDSDGCWLMDGPRLGTALGLVLVEGTELGARLGDSLGNKLGIEDGLLEG